jgi:hypothetical protein
MPAPQAPSTTQLVPERGKWEEQPIVPATTSAASTVPPAPVATSQPEHLTTVEDFPAGWELRKESWLFHRRFYAIFKRAMRHGEYSQLLCQIRPAPPSICGRTAGGSPCLVAAGHYPFVLPDGG